MLRLVHERLKFFSELPDLTRFFFIEPKVDDGLFESNKQLKKLTPEERRTILSAVREVLEDCDFSESDLEVRLRSLVEQLDIKPGILFGLVRAAVTGSNVAPGLFETLHVLGKAKTLSRIDK